MPRDNILKEALADAKVVQQTALENAKLILEEEFRPQLSSMLSAKLRNESELEEAESVNEDNDASSEIGGAGLTVDDPAPKKPSKATSDSSHIKNPGQEVVPALGEGVEDELGGDEEDDSGLAPAAPAATAPAPAATAPAPAAPAGAPDAGMGMGGEPSDEDVLDLEAIIRELELDVQGGEGGEGGVAPDMSAEPEMREGFSVVDAGKDVNAGIKAESTNGANDKSGPGMPAKDGVNGGKEVKPGQEVTGSREGIEEDLNLEAIMREFQQDIAQTNEVEDLRAENTRLKEDLREHRDVVVQLHGKLKEINMLNAKLMYTSKLFRGYNLSESQKRAVIDAFDRTTTPREVKLVYTTLAENFNGKNANGKRSSKAITEGLASKPVASTAPKKSEVLTENTNSDLVKRMQKLAGINI